MQNYLRDFLQGASNAAASTVSGPVDLISALIRASGGGAVIGQAPVGSSEWIAQRGLTRQPVNRLAGLLGESAGLAAPIVAAAKAPQIAAGLLKMGENVAAPRTLGAQRGVLAWHGTPAEDFTEFSLAKYGRTDEGWLGKGVYGAESPVDASAYAAVNGKPAGAVYRVDMDIKKPLVVDWHAPNRSELFAIRRELGPEKFSDWLRSNGYDGVNFLGPKSALNAAGHRDIQWMALDPSQVKQVPVSSR